MFMQRIKQENASRVAYDTDFNFAGHPKEMNHDIRLNKRPLTGKPMEKFGQFT